MSIRTRERDLYELPQLVRTYLNTLHLTIDQCRTNIDRTTLCISIASRYRAILYSAIDIVPQRTLLLETTPFGPTDKVLSDPVLAERVQVQDLEGMQLGPNSMVFGAPKARSADTFLPFVFLCESVFPGIMMDLPQTAVVVTTDGFLLCFSDLQKEFRRDRLCLVRSRLCNYINLYPTEFVTAASVVGVGILPSSPSLGENTKSLNMTLLIGTSLGRVLRAIVRIDEKLDTEASKRAHRTLAAKKLRKAVKFSIGNNAATTRGTTMFPQRSIIKRTKYFFRHLYNGLLMINRFGAGYPLQVSSRSIGASTGKGSLLGENELGVQAYNVLSSNCTLQLVDEPFRMASLGSTKAGVSLLERLKAFFSGYTEVDRLSYPIELKRQVLLQMNEMGHVLTKTGGEKELLKRMRPHKSTFAQRETRIYAPDINRKQWDEKKTANYNNLYRHNLLNPLEVTITGDLAENDESAGHFQSLHQSDLNQHKIYREYEKNASLYFPSIPNDDWITNFLKLDPVLHIRVIEMEATESAITSQILIIYENRVSLFISKAPIIDLSKRSQQKFLSNIGRYRQVQQGDDKHAEESLRRSILFSRANLKKSQKRDDQLATGEVLKEAYDQLSLYGLIERPSNFTALKVYDASSMAFSFQRIFFADKLSTVFPGTRYVSCATETIPQINYTNEKLFITLSDCNVVADNTIVFCYSILALSESKNLRLLDNCPQEGSVTFALLYYNYHTNIMVANVLFNPNLHEHEMKAAGIHLNEISVQDAPANTKTLMMSHIPVSDKLLPRLPKRSKAKQAEHLKSLMLNALNYTGDNFPMSDFYMRRPTLEIPLINSKIGYVITSTQILCFTVLVGVPLLNPSMLSEMYGATSLYTQIYVHNKPIEIFLNYKDELPLHLRSIFDQHNKPTMLQKLTTTLQSLRHDLNQSAQDIRRDIYRSNAIVYYNSYPNVFTICAGRKRSAAFTNRLGLTGKDMDELIFTRGPTASLLKPQELDGLADNNYNFALDNIYDSQATVPLKPYCSERFDGRNFLFPMATKIISAHGFASRYAIHRKIRLIRTIHLTSLLLLTGQGHMRSINNYIDAAGTLTVTKKEGSLQKSADQSIDLLFTSREDGHPGSGSSFLKSRLGKRFHHGDAFDGSRFSPYDLLHASYNAYCSGDALFNLLPQSLACADLEKLLYYIADLSIINNNEDPLWCARESINNDKNFMLSGTLSSRSVHSIDKDEMVRHKRVCELYFKACIQKIENVILLVTFLKETGLWGAKTLVTDSLKMDIRTYLEGTYAISGLIKFFYVYTNRGHEDPILLDSDDCPWIFYEYATFVPGYDETVICQYLEHAIGKYYITICNTDGQFNSKFTKLREIRLNGFEAMLSAVTLATANHLPIVYGLLDYIKDAIYSFSAKLESTPILSNDDLINALSIAQSFDAICIFLQTALVSREINVDLLSIETYNEIPLWLNSLGPDLEIIFLTMCAIISKICNAYELITSADILMEAQPFKLLEYRASKPHELVLVQLVTTISCLSDCILQIFYRSKEAGLEIKRFKDKREKLNHELLALPVKVTRAATVMAKYHDWVNFVQYSFALFELRDLTIDEISRTIIFHPSLSQSINGLSSYFKEYRDNLSASSSSLEMTMIPEEAIPVLPHEMLEIISNVIDAGVLALDLEPLSDLRATLLDELNAQGLFIRATILDDENTHSLATIITGLREPNTNIQFRRPTNDTIMEAIYNLASRCTFGRSVTL